MTRCAPIPGSSHSCNASWGSDPPPEDRATSLQRPELLLRVIPRVDFVVDLRDFPLLVDHVRDALRVFVFRTARRAVRDPDLAIRVAQQRKCKVEFLSKLRIVFDRIKTDAENLSVLLFVLAGEVPEPGTLCRSTGCIGLRIEPQHDLLAAVVAQLRALAAVVGDFEIGCLIANFEHRRTSSDVLPRESQCAGQ